MTLLIGASVVLILASAATLVLGWVNENEGLIWTSIAFSVGAALALALAYVRSRREGFTPAPEAASGDEAAAPPRHEVTEPPDEAPAAAEERPEPAAPVETVEEPQIAAAEGAAAEESAEEVVAIPERKKFHRPSCRYAKAAGAEPIMKSEATRRSYSACGICKP